MIDEFWHVPPLYIHMKCAWMFDDTTFNRQSKSWAVILL